MFKKFAALFVSFTLALPLLGASPAYAATKAEKEARRIEKIKSEIARLGVGRDARIVVRLKDRSLAAGYVKSASAEAFLVSDMKDSRVTYVSYGDITAVKGHNLSTAAWITIGVLVAVGVTVLSILLLRCRNEGGCGA